MRVYHHQRLMCVGCYVGHRERTRCSSTKDMTHNFFMILSARLSGTAAYLSGRFVPSETMLVVPITVP